MCETPGKMHMHDMVKFDIRVVLFEIALKAPHHPRASGVSNIPDRIGYISN